MKIILATGMGVAELFGYGSGCRLPHTGLLLNQLGNTVASLLDRIREKQNEFVMT